MSCQQGFSELRRATDLLENSVDLFKAEFPPPIALFLRTILCRPQLATYITSLHFDCEYFRRWGLGGDPKIAISGELEEPIAFIRATGVTYGDLWIQELRQAPILLSRVNLSPMDDRLPDFHHLRDVSYHIHADDTSRKKRAKNTSDVLPFFYLPTVQRISALIENPVTCMWPAAHLPVSNLTSLDLTIIRETYLGEVLSVTKELETLRWAWYFDIDVQDQFITPIVNLDQLDTALSHVRGTLADLTILAECGRGFDPFHPSIKTVGSLNMANFNKLKNLQIPLPFLVGFAHDTTKRLQDVVPRNIEYLLITDNLRQQNMDVADRTGWPLWEWDDFAITDLIRSWLEDWRAYTPHLRGITVRLECSDWDIGEWPPEMIQQFRDLGAQAGVEVEIIDLTSIEPLCTWLS
ncbi:hypothetical protein BO94DRAFT_541430 [Aspergillus sclerotioniger CBS 115572]|uniref:F-box domain-containing protein n=1 Tax=Aspergillus sclerotioniger CBS 115572 TaxID=1450535 RepID=A0A317XHH5_9EURO|nr:hypothetical protein BO94DRAFT_541430 [Aspergillus sclerotioniger CBS 115572]PWY96630.1 hypothetical protein BO94DRAFT_541430 [Aspergillus sclerotioniger CBS 115572]